MAVIKKRTQRKLSKHLTKVVKKHGAGAALALVTGIVSNVAAAIDEKAARKSKATKVRTIVIRKPPSARRSR